MQTIDPFSYLSVLFSIIIGLGIAHLLKGAAYFIHRRKQIVLYIPTLVWWVVLFILHVQIWWVSFERRTLKDWDLMQFIVFITLPIVTYMASFILIPESEGHHNLDLKKVYFNNRRWFFGFVILLPSVSIFQEYVLSGQIDYTLDFTLRLVFLGLGILGWLISAPIFHFWNALLVLALLLYYENSLFQQLR